MSLDPGLVRPFAIYIRSGRIRAIPSYTGIPVRVGARNLHRALDLLLGRQPVAGMIRRWRYS